MSIELSFKTVAILMDICEQNDMKYPFSFDELSKQLIDNYRKHEPIDWDDIISDKGKMIEFVKGLK
jgi:hypothetical protein